MKLANKVVIITGASSGIGRGMAYLFAKEGANVVVADINVAGGKETVATIKKNGGKAEFIQFRIAIITNIYLLIFKYFSSIFI